MKASRAGEFYEGVDGLRPAIDRYLSTYNKPTMADEPTIIVAPSIKMWFPTWVEGEVGLKTNVDHALPAESCFEDEKYAKFFNTQLNANHIRHEMVLVRRPNREPRGQLNTMSYRKVAQLLLLFKRKHWEGPHGYGMAFVEWFDTKGPTNKHSGLYPLARSKRREIISVALIERPVHLIPKFGNQIGETYKVKLELERKLEVINSKRGTQEGTQRLSDLVMSHYSDFWLNTFLDVHLYKTIY